MTFASLAKTMNYRQKVAVFSMDRDGEDTELFSGDLGDCPHGLAKFEVAFIDSDVEVDNYPIKNTLHGVIVITLDEVPDGYLG